MIKIIKESSSPEVGPFYVIDGAVFADTEDVRSLAPNKVGFVDTEGGHYDYWSMLQRYYPEFRRIDYDYYPRGRVVYKSKENKYYLYADKCILNNEKWLDEVFDELSLPRGNTEVGWDEHYQCHECNEHYENVAADFALKSNLMLSKIDRDKIKDRDPKEYADPDDEYGHW